MQVGPHLMVEAVGAPQLKPAPSLASRVFLSVTIGPASTHMLRPAGGRRVGGAVDERGRGPLDFQVTSVVSDGEDRTIANGGVGESGDV